MGTDKAFVEIDGQPMVLRTAQALRDAGATWVAVVGGERERLAALGLVVIDDPEPGAGPLAGIVSALELAAEPDLVIVLACDLIAPDPGAIGTTVATLAREPAAAAAVPRLGGNDQWMHAAWRRSLALTPLRAALDQGERSVRAGAAALPLVRPGPIDPAVLRDADTADDLPPGGAAIDLDATQ
jgi:molybdenum cofactor guanylyltransferase